MLYCFTIARKIQNKKISSHSNALTLETIVNTELEKVKV